MRRRKNFLQERNSSGDRARVPREFRASRLAEAVMLGRGASTHTGAYQPPFLRFPSALLRYIPFTFGRCGARAFRGSRRFAFGLKLA